MIKQSIKYNEIAKLIKIMNTNQKLENDISSDLICMSFYK